jgi:hypothetical protein
MDENHELPKIAEIKTFETDFSRIIGAKDWCPNNPTGPFLPIDSKGDGNLPYKMADMQKSTFIDYSQKLVCI